MMPRPKIVDWLRLHRETMPTKLIQGSGRALAGFLRPLAQDRLIDRWERDEEPNPVNGQQPR